MRIVVDWDGTVTEEDTLHVALERFGDREIYHRTEAELGRRLTLHEVIGIEMATITATLEEVVAYLLDTVALRAGFADLVASRDVLVLSAGFHELIAPLLDRERLRPRVLANRIEALPAGWRAIWRDEEPCDVCGEPCKRGAVAGLGPFVFVGDGSVTDRCVSLAAARVFARDGLAAYLAAEDVPFEPFDDFHDLARAL